jgi:hypothetical protein
MRESLAALPAAMLALSLTGVAHFRGRDAVSTPEHPVEIGQVPEADLEGDIGAALNS